MVRRIEVPHRDTYDYIKAPCLGPIFYELANTIRCDIPYTKLHQAVSDISIGTQYVFFGKPIPTKKHTIVRETTVNNYAPMLTRAANAYFNAKADYVLTEPSLFNIMLHDLAK